MERIITLYNVHTHTQSYIYNIIIYITIYRKTSVGENFHILSKTIAVALLLTCIAHRQGHD